MKLTLESLMDDIDSLLSDELMEEATTSTYLIRDRIYPMVESVLSTPIGDRKFKDLVRRFIDRNSEKLHTSGPVHMISFTDVDKEEFFNVFHTTKSDLTRIITEMTKSVNAKSDWKLLRQNPIFTLFYECIRYYTLKNSDTGVNAALCIYALSVYPSVFSSIFKYGANPDVMQYTIDHLSAKYLMKNQGSVFKTLMFSIQQSYKFLKDGIIDSSDAEVLRFIFRIRNDQKSLLKNVANHYYDNYRKGLRVSTTMEVIGDTKDINVDSLNNTSIVSDISRKISLSIITNGIDTGRCTAAARVAGVSFVDLRFYLTRIMISDNSSDVNKFIESILMVFLYQEKHDTREINDKLFLQFGMELFRRTNTVDPNIITIKNLLSRWSESTGVNLKFKRDASRTAYKKAIFLYVILCIQYYND